MHEWRANVPVSAAASDSAELARSIMMARTSNVCQCSLYLHNPLIQLHLYLHTIGSGFVSICIALRTLYRCHHLTLAKLI